MNTLAVISSEGAINAVIWIVVVGLIFGLLFWLVDFCTLPAPFNKVAKVVLALAAVVILINALLGFTGHPIFNWRG